jgi:hypothetical protein
MTKVRHPDFINIVLRCSEDTYHRGPGKLKVAGVRERFDKSGSYVSICLDIPS